MENYIKKLNWDISEKEFDSIKNVILKDKNFDYSKLILPNDDKSLWDNCARIIVNMNDDDFIKLLPEILEWLKDLNWPGAKIIFEKIESFSTDIIEKSVLYVLDKARKERDFVWIEFILWLNNVKTKNIVKKVIEITKELKTDEIPEVYEWLENLPDNLVNKEVVDIINNYKILNENN